MQRQPEWRDNSKRHNPKERALRSFFKRNGAGLRLLATLWIAVLTLSGCSLLEPVESFFDGGSETPAQESYDADKVRTAEDVEETLASQRTAVERDHRLDLPAPWKPQELTTAQKLADFDYLYHIFETDYSFFGVLKRVQGIDWRANREAYRKRIENTANDYEFKNEITNILADFHSGHVGMAPKEEVKSILEHYSYYTYIGSIEEEFIGMNSQVVRNRYGLKGVQPNTRSEEEIAGDESLWRKNAVVNDLVAGKVASIRIPEMLSSVEWGYDKELIEDYLKKVADYPVLVIDIRGNPGGLMEYWKDFLVPAIADKTYEATNYLFFRGGEASRTLLSEMGLQLGYTKRLDVKALGLSHPEDLVEFPRYYKDVVRLAPAADSIHYTGHIYLLVDRYVYSAAEAFASFSKMSGFATLVGERTGGDGLTAGMMYRYLPNSGYVFTYTNALGYAQDGTINDEVQTMPDIETNDEIQAILERESL